MIVFNFKIKEQKKAYDSYINNFIGELVIVGTKVFLNGELIAMTEFKDPEIKKQDGKIIKFIKSIKNILK